MPIKMGLFEFNIIACMNKKPEQNRCNYWSLEDHNRVVYFGVLKDITKLTVCLELLLFIVASTRFDKSALKCQIDGSSYMAKILFLWRLPTGHV